VLVLLLVLLVLMPVLMPVLMLVLLLLLMLLLACGLVGGCWVVLRVSSHTLRWDGPLFLVLRFCAATLGCNFGGPPEKFVQQPIILDKFCAILYNNTCTRELLPRLSHFF
jgi:hypothetical protein